MLDVSKIPAVPVEVSQQDGPHHPSTGDHQLFIDSGPGVAIDNLFTPYLAVNIADGGEGDPCDLKLCCDDRAFIPDAVTTGNGRGSDLGLFHEGGHDAIDRSPMLHALPNTIHIRVTCLHRVIDDDPPVYREAGVLSQGHIGTYPCGNHSHICRAGTAVRKMERLQMAVACNHLICTRSKYDLNP